MKRFTLRGPVRVDGFNVLGDVLSPDGGMSSLIFTPVSSRNGSSHGPIIWKPSGSGILPEAMRPSAAAYNEYWRNINLRHSSGRKIHVIEHLPFAILGLSDVCIETTSHLPPYVMPGFVWEQLRPQLIETDERCRWKTPKSPVIWTYPELRNGREAFTKLEPSSKPTLTLDISISYKGIGEARGIFDIRKLGSDGLAEIMKVGPQGVYPIWKKLLAHLVTWPHLDTIVWPDVSSPEAAGRTLELFIAHRLTDVLGALMLLCHDGRLPAGHLTSVCSGHLADLMVVQEADKGRWVDVN